MSDDIRSVDSATAIATTELVTLALNEFPPHVPTSDEVTAHAFVVDDIRTRIRDVLDDVGASV
jgi:hypothetical protein